MSEGTGAAPCAVASCGAAPGRVSSDDVRTDVGVTGGPMFAGVTSDVTSDESGTCSAAPCRSQGLAAEVKSEVMGDGEAAFLAASVAGGMSGRVSLTMFAGVGAGGSSAPSRSRFFGGVRGRHRNGGGGGVEELGQRLLEDSDAGIERGKGIVGNRA